MQHSTLSFTTPPFCIHTTPHISCHICLPFATHTHLHHTHTGSHGCMHCTHCMFFCFFCLHFTSHILHTHVTPRLVPHHHTCTACTRTTLPASLPALHCIHLHTHTFTLHCTSTLHITMCLGRPPPLGRLLSSHYLTHITPAHMHTGRGFLLVFTHTHTPHTPFTHHYTHTHHTPHTSHTVALAFHTFEQFCTQVTHTTTRHTYPQAHSHLTLPPHTLHTPTLHLFIYTLSYPHYISIFFHCRFFAPSLHTPGTHTPGWTCILHTHCLGYTPHTRHCTSYIPPTHVPLDTPDTHTTHFPWFPSLHTTSFGLGHFATVSHSLLKHFQFVPFLIFHTHRTLSHTVHCLIFSHTLFTHTHLPLLTLHNVKTLIIKADTAYACAAVRFSQQLAPFNQCHLTWSVRSGGGYPR